MAGCHVKKLFIYNPLVLTVLFNESPEIKALLQFGSIHCNCLFYSFAAIWQRTSKTMVSYDALDKSSDQVGWSFPSFNMVDGYPFQINSNFHSIKQIKTVFQAFPKFYSVENYFINLFIFNLPAMG